MHERAGACKEDRREGDLGGVWLSCRSQRAPRHGPWRLSHLQVLSEAAGPGQGTRS
ncbi:unnamed protein product [Symbiodinium pilosum]|uniref:Uncharacterized protein n=1 Tax=Symbiodinium pilosum TaxID=2952 RepID=A0A812U989_SYMPI|nr:unnamed protein product [Symbiodinium pilosum]